jgi:N utilization substance protein A
VREVLVDDETKEATVVVPDDQLSLAIGKEGLNARLAARLTGWRIDIVSETDFARSEAEAAFGGEDGEEFSGRCAAILANGKRCPNTSLPGSRYCGIPAHRELAAREEAGEVVETAVQEAPAPEAEAEAESEAETEAEAPVIEAETEEEAVEAVAEAEAQAEATEEETPAQQ